MIPRARVLLVICGLSVAVPLSGQLPFYTDDPAVTERGKWHFEFFNEFDALQHQYPSVRQNTANYKLNYGLPHNLELDVDAPYLAIFRVVGSPTSTGTGDTNMGIKWHFHDESPGSPIPSLAASLYIEFPTGDARNQLGSGLTDYWLNLILGKAITDKTRWRANLGYLFAGNTSTGDVGIRTTRGHVQTAGFSVLHDFTSRLTLGAEVYIGYADNAGLGKSQLQGMLGGQYAIRNGMSFAFGVLGGKYVASPRIGGQIGVAVDFPDVFHAPREAKTEVQ